MIRFLGRDLFRGDPENPLRREFDNLFGAHESDKQTTRAVEKNLEIINDNIARRNYTQQFNVDTRDIVKAKLKGLRKQSVGSALNAYEAGKIFLDSHDPKASSRNFLGKQKELELELRLRLGELEEQLGKLGAKMLGAETGLQISGESAPGETVDIKRDESSKTEMIAEWKKLRNSLGFPEEETKRLAGLM